MSLILTALVVVAVIVGPVLFLVLLDRRTARSDWGKDPSAASPLDGEYDDIGPYPDRT